MNKLVLPSGSSNRGAQMGRSNILPTDENVAVKLQMEKLKWVDGDYDQFGAYWGGGTGDNVYCAFGEWSRYGYSFQEVKVFVRAKSRNEAKELVREYLPNCLFYR